MTIDEFLSDPKRVARYKAWINMDIGQEVLGLLRKHFLRPIQPGQIGQVLNKDTAAYCLGENSGAWKIHDALENFANIEQLTMEGFTETYDKPEEEREPKKETEKNDASK